MEKMRKIDWVGIAVIIGMFLFFALVDGPEPVRNKFDDCDSVEYQDPRDQGDRTRWTVKCFIYVENEDGTQDSNQ